MSLKNWNKKTSVVSSAEATSVGKINLENNANFNRQSNLDGIYDEAPLKANYTKQELANVDVPDKIGKEIRAQKYRIFFVELIGFLMIAVSVFFIACYYGATKVTNGAGVETKWLIPAKDVPVPGAMFPLLVVGLVIFILSTMEHAHLNTNIKSYKADLLEQKGGVPYFLIKSYKSLIARVVYANWLAITLYVLEGIIIGIFWGLKKGLHADSYNTELIIMYVLAGVTFLTHMFVLLTARYRKGNLNSYFNTQIVSTEEAQKISSHANKICLFIFLIVFFVLFIIWCIVRRKNNKSILPWK